MWNREIENQDFIQLNDHDIKFVELNIFAGEQRSFPILKISKPLPSASLYTYTYERTSHVYLPWDPELRGEMHNFQSLARPYKHRAFVLARKELKISCIEAHITSWHAMTAPFETTVRGGSSFFLY